MNLLLEQAESFVCNLFKDKLSNLFTYHNSQHTFDVVKAVETLCEHENVSESDIEIVTLAAWFHDTGYTISYENHEDSSIIIAKDFLKARNKSNEYIERIAHLIRVTKFNAFPETKLEKILRDADYSHFANPEYINVCALLRNEWENTLGKKYSDLEWATENYRILSECHYYYTDFAIANWKPLKDNNIKLIEKTIKEMKETKDIKVKINSEKEKKSKNKKPDRGIDTLFRITLSNHTRLSGIADSKANILLSVNAIIISIALSSIIPKLDSPSNAHLVMPTFVLLMFSVVSIIFAILSTRPKVTRGVFSKEDVESRKVNLLFFGNFYKMPLEEYQDAVNEMMKDNDYLYNSLIKDLYFLGLVLEKKYRLLRITYNIFMVGIIISVIAFVIAFYSVRA